MDKTKAVSVLTDLIKVNQDRISAYSKASTIINGNDLNEIFAEVIEQGSSFTKELQQEIASYGIMVSPVVLPTTRVYRTWKDFDIAFTAQSARRLLITCEYVEAALEAVYNSALDETGIPANAVVILLKQRREIKEIHHKIKKYRDASAHSVEGSHSEEFFAH